MEKQNEIQIFLSYSRQDQDTVLKVYEYLVKKGFPNTWIDCKKLLPGQPWEFEIQRNLKKSEIIIIFLSDTSVNKRGFLQKELKKSLNYLEEKLTGDIYIIPVKLDIDAIIPDELSGIQWLDLINPDSYDLLKQSLVKQTEKLGFEISKDEKLLDEIHVAKKLYSEAWEGLPGYEVEFAVPLFHSTKYGNIGEVTKIIEASFIKRLQYYRKNKIEQLPVVFSWSQDKYRRTNFFDATYNSIFHQHNFLSINFGISWYGAGAAHPNRNFNTFNFLLNPLIEIEGIDEIFIDKDNSFETICKYVRKILLEKPLPSDEGGNQGSDQKLLDKDWIEKGTKSWSFFQVFTFSKEGLEFHFAPYQVGSYACGSQTTDNAILANSC